MNHSNTIPGIYNYCDRWCERCCFTSRCAIYEDNSNLSPEQRDINNKAFWDKISESFQQAMKLLREAASAQGIDLDNIPPEELKSIQEKERTLEDKCQNHPLNMAGSQYTRTALNWLKKGEVANRFMFSRNQQMMLGLRDLKEIKTEIITFKDCLAVIEWYAQLIHPKLHRALSGKLGDRWEGLDDAQKDCDGSAKIALIAIDRSIAAWLLLYKLVPETEDDCLKMLSTLDQLKNLANAEFPDANKFIRPGFDESV